MVFSLLPTAVLAADGEDPDTSADPGQVTQQNPENPDDQADPDDLNDSENSDDSDAPQLLGEGLGSELSRSCGATPADTVSWALTKNDDGRTYTLTISGDGAMADYYAQYVQRPTEFLGDIAPWRRALLSNPDDERTTNEVVPITKVEIGEGVTRIGSGAFAYTELTGTVTFSENVTSYGDGVFARDTSIKAVDWTNFKPTETIRDGWATVYTEEHIAIPYAFFDGCSSLDTSIVDGTVYSGQLVLPDTIEAIYVAAFRGTGFSKVDFSDGLSSICAVGSYAITKLANMTEFTYPGNVDFYGVNDEGQNNVIQGGGIKKLTIAKEVTTLPVSFCTDTESLTVIEFESGSQLREIGKTAFYNTKALESIDIPSTVTSIGESAFANCFSLEKIELGQIESLGQNTFANCSSLETAKIQGSPNVIYPPNMFSMWTGYSAAPLKTLEIGAGNIRFGLNNQKDSIETVVLGDGVTEIPNHFAAGCTKLTSVSLPDALTSVPVYAFNGCSSLKKIGISENSKLQYIGNGAFGNSALTQIYIPKGVISIGESAFNRTPITVFDMSDVIADHMAVGDYAINNWYAPSEKPPVWKNNFKYIYVSNSGAAASVEEKTNCCDYAFFVTNGGSVDATKTGFAAVYREGYTAKWYDNKDFTGNPVTGKPENGKTYYVQWTAGELSGFCGAAGNEQNVRWVLADNGDGYTLSITGTGAMADYTCNITGSDATQPWRASETGVVPTAITKVVVGKGVTNIGNFACDGLSQVKEYNIAASVEDIGPWGVCGQNAVTYTLNGSTHYVVTPDGVLMSADGETLVSYPGGKGAVDEYAIPNTVKTILDGAFVGIDAKKVVIPNSVTSFPRYSFGGSTVEEIEFNANVKTLEKGAFSGLSQLKSLVFGDTTLTTINEQACSNLSGLTEITFPDSLTTIGAQAFKVISSEGAAAPNLKKVTFGKGMSTIGGVVFLRQSALEVIDMTHCEGLTDVGEFNSHNYDDNVTHPYTTTPIVYTADADVAELVKQKNGNHLIYAVTNDGTFPADTVFETGKLAKPEKEGCLFLDWYKSADFSGEKVTTFEAGQTYYAKWMDHIPEPTDADLANGLVTVKCLNPVAHPTMQYGLNAAVAHNKYTMVQVSATEYSVTYDADAFAVNGHSLYSAKTLNWTLTYDGSKWNLKSKTSGVDDVVLVTHAPTTLNEVTEFIDGRTDVIKTSCVNGETATCAYGLMVAFVKPDHVVSVEQEKNSSGEPIPGSYIATLKMDQFVETCAKACNSKSFADSPRAHDVLSQNPVKWRFQVRQAEVSTDTGTEKQYVWLAEPVTPGTDDVCTIAHNWVVTFNPDNGEPAFTQAVKYEGKATAPDTPEKEGCEFTGWYLNENDKFDFNTTITADTTLTAHWTIMTVDVFFDPNGGNELAEADKTKVVKIGEAYGELPVPTRTGYTFDGWYTAAEDGTVVTADTTVTATTDHTLYAHWTLIPPTADSKPSYSGVNVRVKCVDNKSEHKQGAYFYGLVYGLSDYSGINEPESWVNENGEYFYTLTINKDVYIARYANTTKTAHTEVGENKTEVKWQWNGTKWVLLNEKDDKSIVLTINVKCEEKQTVQVVIYRNGDTTKAYDTKSLGKMPKGTVIDLTKLNIADYYTANYTGKYDFYGWFNDGAWNEYKKNPERAGLDSITVNGWTNIICMVYDYENVVYYMSDADRVADNRLFATTARKGAALPTADAPTATRDGYTFKFWSREGQSTDVSGQTVNGWTNLVANWEKKSYNVVAKLKVNGELAYDPNDALYTQTVSGKFEEAIDFASIEAWALDLAEKTVHPDAASYTVEYEDGTEESLCSTYGQHEIDQETHTIYVNVKTTEHVYVYRMVDGLMQPTEYHHSTAPFGANVVEHLNANVTNLDMPGYSHDEWFMKDVPSLDIKFGDTDTINGWTNVVIKYTKNEFPVTYDYACTDPALEPNWKVWETLPKNSYTYAPGESVRVAMMPDDVEDGEYIWKFVTWKLGDTEVAPNTQVEMVAGGLTFVGIWERTQKEYGVIYDYACTDPALVPNWKVCATLPENKDTYTVGQKVTTAAKPDDVEDGEYIWKFVTWKLGDTEGAPNTQVEMVAGGLTFVGIWERTQKEYDVTYSYDPSLPDEVQATLPKNPDTYTVGQKVTTAAKPDSVRVGEYIWTFKTWKLDGVEVAPNTQVPMVSGGLHFEGIWQKELIHYSLTIQYVDKKDKELDKSHVELLPKGDAYKVDSPKIKGYKLEDKDDAVIEGKMPGHDLTIKVVYVRKTSGGSGVQIESPNKPEKDNSLKFNTAEHFAYVNGYPDGTVKPEGNVTRAEVAAILYRVMDADCVKTYETTRCSFSDVVRGDWFNTYVATLENAGVIVDTRTNGKFRPNEAITRAELAAMLAQFADIKSAANPFNDVSARHWASDEIAVCAKMGWINGYPDGSFRPDATITRAEMMAMINRALDRTPKSVSDLLSGMKTWSDNANTGAWYYLDVQEATNSHTYTKSGTHETWKKLH